MKLKDTFLKINKKFKGVIPPLSKEELNELENSIKGEGCREALIIWKGTIVDGHNRYVICNKLGIDFKTRSKSFKDEDEALAWIITNQLARRNLSDYDRVKLVLKKEEIFKRRAKEHQKAGGQKSGVGRQKSDKPLDVKKEVAKIANVSHDTVSRVKFIEKKADKKTKKKLSNQQLTINKVYRDLKKAEKRQKIKDRFKAPKFPKKGKKYEIIYADPPWNFKHYSDKGKGRSPDNYYKTMSLEDIKGLPIEDLASDNCILFLWTTFPFLEKSFEVIKSWGFTYKTVGFVWVKRNRKSSGWFWGMGYWTRSNAEICIIATKGSITRQSSSVFQIVDLPIEEHSKKPDIVRNKIVELVGELPRIELFARQKVNGWDTWGNEMGGFNGNKKVKE